MKGTQIESDCNRKKGKRKKKEKKMTRGKKQNTKNKTNKQKILAIASELHPLRFRTGKLF